MLKTNLIMKHFLTLALFYLISFSTFSQSHKEVITKEVKVYFNNMTTQNFDGVLDYMYPKIFDMAPRAQMKLGMEQMFNAKDMRIEFLANDITKISDKMEVDDIAYAAVFYDSKMKMTFLTEDNQTQEDKKGFLMFMKSTMQTQFGEDNVTDDLDTMSLIIKMSATMYAINDPQYQGWKFLGNDDALKMLVDKIVPETVRTQLLNN